MTATLLTATGILLSSYFAASAGTVVAWGDNSSGQTNVPAGVTNAMAIAGGLLGSLALTPDRMVVPCGDNNYYQMNVPADATNVVAIAAGYLDYLVLKGDGTVVQWGNMSSKQFYGYPPAATNIISIATKGPHSLALKSDGTVAAWGNNDSGQATVPAGLSNVIAVAAGDYHSLALKSDGTVVAWGDNSNGQCNVPSGLSNVVAISAGWRHSLALKPDGTVVLWGDNTYHQLDTVPCLTNVVAIDGGQFSSLALRADGTIVSWPGDCDSQNSLSNVMCLAAGWTHALALTGQQAPQIVRAPTALTVLAEGTALFSVDALGTQPLRYQWQLNGTNLDGAVRPALLLTNLQPGQAGLYSVIVSNDLGAVTNFDAMLSVLPLVISVQPTNQTVYGGDGVTNTVAAQGAGLLYQWRLNRVDLLEKTNSVLTLTAVTTNDAGYYSVVVSNNYASVESSNATLIVTPLAIVLQPAGQNLYVGDSAVFTVAVQKNGPFNYQWRFGEIDLPGETNATLSLTNLTTSQNGNYTVLVSNPYGSLESSNAVLTVVDSAPIILSQPVNQVTWPGGNATFQISADGSKPLSYQWRFKGTNVADATNATFSLTGVATNQAGSYSVVVSNAVGSITSSSVTLTLVPVVVWGDTNNGLSTLSTSLTNAIGIAAGYTHSLALKPDGTVVAWGDMASPFGLTNVAAIVAGYNQSLALKSNSTVVAWGYGSLPSVPAGLSNVVALAMGYSQYSPLQNVCLALKADGTVVGWGFNSTIINVPPGLNGITAIAAGMYHALALRSAGTVTAWLDYSDYNANRVPTNLNNVVQIAAGLRHSLALKSDGTVVAWGYNSHGETNVPVGLSNVVNIAAGGYHSLALRSDGTVVSWGYNNKGQTNIPAGLSNIVAVAGGGYHSLALIGSTNSTIVRQPKSAFGLPRQPVLLSVGAVSPGSLSYQWQFNGQNITDATNPVYRIASLSRADQGGYQVLISDATQVITSAVAQVTMNGNSVVAWGWNLAGQTNVPAGLSAVAVAGGDMHTLALRPGGTVAAWGDNSYHQTNVPSSVTNVVSITSGAGAYHSLALKADGRVSAWGGNYYGECNVPASITNAVMVAAGYGYSLALKPDGKITQWGSLSPPPSGLSNVVAIAGGYSHALALKSDGTMSAWGNNPSRECNVPASLSNVISIVAGREFSVALSTNGTVTAWGRNDYGQTNVPTGLSNVVAIAAGDYHGLALKSDGMAVAWGWNDYGQTNVPGGYDNLVGIAGGGSHSLMLVGSADPAIVRQPAPVYASVFGRVLLSVGAAGSQPLSYQWRTNGVPIPGATNSWLDLPAALPANSGIYSVVVSNTLGVAVSSNSTVNVIARSPFILTQPFGQTNIGGATATFQAAAAGSLPFNYQWRKADAGLLDATNPALTLNNLTRSNSGAYSVIVSNAFGFVTSSNAMLRVMVPQQLQAPIINPDGSMAFKFGDSDSGLLSSNDIAHFTISASTNLVNWDVLTNPLFLTNGLLWLQDSSATNWPQRFYRVIENP